MKTLEQYAELKNGLGALKQRFRVGQLVRFTNEALENYGPDYAGKAFRIESVATAYMPTEEFFAKGKPDGFHPGYDGCTKSALYDLKGVNCSLYDWELTRA